MLLKYDSYTKKVYSLQEYIDDCYGGLPNESMLEEQWNKLPTVTIDYDSESDTLKHIKRVNELLIYAATNLLNRAVEHDASKLSNIEKPLFDEFTPKLKNTTYGSEEYHEYLRQLKPALDSHYNSNRHHPEYWTDGLGDMDLFDIVEMFLDWKAASERHADGNILESIKINKKRFGLNDQLAQIFANTIAILPNKTNQ